MLKSFLSDFINMQINLRKINKRNKKQIEDERGEEIRFTPKLETEKYNSKLEVVKERTNVYSNLYDDSQRRETTKKLIKENMSAKHVPGEELYLTISKPKVKLNYKPYTTRNSSKKRGVVKFYNEIDNKEKQFSSFLYATKKKRQPMSSNNEVN